MAEQYEYAIFAKGTFFDDAGWPYEEKFFGKRFKTCEEAQKVLDEILNQDAEFDTPEFNQEYDDFYDPSMDTAQFEIVSLDPEDRSDGGIFFRRDEPNE